MTAPAAIPPNHCMRCKQRYYRRNQMEVWRLTKQGGRKDKIRHCLECQPETLSDRMLQAAHLAAPRRRSNVRPLRRPAVERPAPVKATTGT